MSGLLRSWVGSANAPGADFPLNNLPCGVASPEGGAPRCVTAIGDMALDLAAMEAAGRLDFGGSLQTACWNAFMARGAGEWARLRAELTALLCEGAEEAGAAPFLFPLSGARLHMPFTVTEFTDFYAGKHHAENVGTIFRGRENALPANWLSIPIGYNGRASSIVVSGTDVRRPMGQLKGEEDRLPRFGPAARWDFELELGAVIGQPSQGRVTVGEADAMIFGYVLLNDWSARDIQAWEYQPLGPFQSKAAATSISAWIVTAAALAPFRCATPPRERELLSYLAEPGPMLFDIGLEVTLAPDGAEEALLCRTNARELYYSAAQQLAHHTSSGCPMRVGDLIGSGTISGPKAQSRGSLLEMTWAGAEPVTLPSGAVRRFIEDGDTVIMRGAAEGQGYRIGFGECRGKTLPAL